ncbi:MAG: ABC transporter substrate-binding protein [Fuerstiella sp.]|nr:ABC transporter substrate-binding protein [Fuerstiella sp.]
MRSEGPKSLDPIRGSTVYENRCASQVIETLLQYKYLKRPFELEPLLLSEMPTSEDQLTWTFQLKKGVHFHDDPCFPEGRGRELTTSDVFYSWKRMADTQAGSKVWWVIKDTIVGFDDFRKKQQRRVDAGENFDYDAPVAGLTIVSDYEFRVTLTQPSARFFWVLAMFQTGVVPREAIARYGSRFGLHPVGTGPFVLKPGDWQFGLSMTFRRNPNYHECRFPNEHMPEDERHGLHQAAGRKLPLLDVIHVSFFQQDQPMWLHFRAEDFDFAQVPAENFPQVFTKRTVDKNTTVSLRPRWKDQGIRSVAVPLLDFIFFGFNMDDELLGGMSQNNRKLRQAICLALDWNERNETFYNGLNVVYDGVIPPSLEGHPPAGQSPHSYRGPNIERAKQLLAEAGYPDGRGLPVIDYFTSQGRNNREQSEMLRRQLATINVRIKNNLVDFPTLISTVDRRKAAFFSFAWGSDYPDGENNLALFYGPNESPGSNHYNYNNPEYDALYEQILGMQPSPKRTAIYERMQQMLLEDCPYAGSMARTRYYVIHRRLKYFKPVETFENWFKYVDIQNDSSQVASREN